MPWKGIKGGGDGGADAAINAIKSLPAEQQTAAFESKLVEIMSQHEQLKSSLSAAVSRYEAAEKSNSQLNADYTKATLSKGQLESLCRELQKQNKLIKEENLARVREEEEKRRELSARLNTTLADITGLLEQNKEKNTELRQDNQNMAMRLNDLVTQYSERQENIDKILHQRDLQLQLAEAKLAKAAIESSEEREIFLRDKKKMLEELQLYQEKLTRMATIEITLRQQLTSYSDQYAKFEKTAQTSNTIINKFKKEMDLMGKKMKKLEKETLSWQTKCAQSNSALLDALTERAQFLAKIERLTKQNEKLQQLARGLQAQLVEERKANRKGGDGSEDIAAAGTLSEKVEQVISEAFSPTEETGNSAPTTGSDTTPNSIPAADASADQVTDNSQSDVHADSSEVKPRHSHSSGESESAEFDSSAATVELSEIASQLTEVSSQLAALTGKRHTVTNDPGANSEETCAEVTEAEPVEAALSSGVSSAVGIENCGSVSPSKSNSSVTNETIGDNDLIATGGAVASCHVVGNDDARVLENLVSSINLGQEPPVQVTEL
ncbi:hypothetical protein HAZT_HAZT008297 [Hyalella azteca]|uniref:Alpha-taxilin n=1 Tax=Hyalella azteca TaxID=294128 RepID=A0A6A0GU62_HYAAZ|nr:hypothetical protein HAZT_HAZT008297 [Hyalella azteca]